MQKILKAFQRIWPADKLVGSGIGGNMVYGHRFAFVVLFMTLISPFVKAQSFNGPCNAQIMIMTTEGNRMFSATKFHAIVLPQDGVVELKCKASSFVNGLTLQDSIVFCSMFNMVGNPVIKFAAQFPKGFKLPTSTQSKTVDMEGFMQVGGVTKRVTYPMTFNNDGKKLTIQFDNMVDAKAWGLIIPAEYRNKVTGMVRILINN